MKKLFLFLGVFIGCSQILLAQTKRRFQPSYEEMVKRYERAGIIDSITKNVVFKQTVTPHWTADGKAFWYCNILKDSVQEYIFVNAMELTKKPLFHPQRLAEGLRALGITIDPQRPSLKDLTFVNAKTILFEVNGGLISCDLTSYSCQSKGRPTVAASSNSRRSFQRNHSFPDGSISPDKKWEAYLENGNLFVKPVTGGAAIQFTTNGTADKPYGGLRWSPNSKYLAGYHMAIVKDDPVYYILTSETNTSRGQLRSQAYKQPGDPWSVFTPFVFMIDSQKAVKLNTEPIDFLTAPQQRWRTGDAAHFTYEKADRGHQRFRMIEVDVVANTTRNVVDEKTQTFIYQNRNDVHFLPGNQQLIRTSEKDGWRHMYLVDVATGKEQQVTKGNWVVRSVDSIDSRKKEIWFTASGMNAEEDPYNIHYYRIGFNGKGLVSLTPAKGNHSLSFSGNGAYFTDTYSEVNMAPKTFLGRSSDGKPLLLLEEADITLLQKTGVHPPEVFVAKGRDGKTDIWGIVSKPSDLDTNNIYPVLENIYAGPHDAFVPKNFVPYSEMQSLAEHGFIVVMIDGMGTANRSKAFHDVCWKNIADAGLEDRILWIKALGRKYGYVDTTRVGIYGTSAGGQSSTGALLFHPEFYTAAVSACGCHDNRVDKQWWNEQWMGYPVGKHYEEQSNVTNAYKLQGNLLLIVGEADTNVPPESTYRVATELIKAQKKFDFLSIPGMGHSDGGAYGRQRKRDFFVEHLLEVKPPLRNTGVLSRFTETGRERWSFQ